MNDLDSSRLILAVLRGRFDEAEALAGASDPPEAQRFVRLATRCEVPSWLHHRLETAGRWDLVGDAVHAEMDRMRRKIRNDNLLLLARLERALDHLAQRGVRPIALKGADTLHRFYGGFDRRMVGDIDLLIRREELREGFAALREAGWSPPDEPERSHYIRGSHHLPLHGEGEVPIELELHWNLVQEERYRLDAAELFARAVPLTIAGREVLRLEDHDHVAHLLLHHFSHYFAPGLKSLVDMEFLTAQPGFDWSRVAERIREWGGTVAAGAALAHIRKLWPELIPPGILRMMPLRAWRRWMTWPLRSGHPLELFRSTRNRRVQLYLAGIMLEKPAALPGWLLRRATRDQRIGTNPLDGA